ncbi:putative phospholipase B-like 2 [Hyalella azteca]|uniref:Phospholipase B-like n=1 Tax=Hyalella azteca TaxID=294128 RepID=A0A8B7P5X9_HYAAZ|nr:putative phospholipase B-like 2 [Hyalella azteca]
MKTLAVALLACLVTPALCRVMSVTLQDDPLEGNTEVTLQLHDGLADNWIARTNYSDETFTNGWAFLELETRPVASDSVQAYSAGYLEAAASHAIIYNSWRNTMKGYCDWQGEEYCVKLREFVKINFKWMLSMIKKHSADDPLWYQAGLVLRQLQGLMDGYAKHNTEGDIPSEDILWMNMSGDLEDLESALKQDNSSRVVRGDGHCSALVKLLPGNTDLFASHVTWNSLQSMLRMQKRYILPFQPEKFKQGVARVPGHTAAFSSYPGILHSADDFYLLSSGLLSMETTIGNSNPALWSNIQPQGEIQEWIRVLVANRLAVDGKSWTKIFRRHNSGTYNNQWMVVDYKRFLPNKVVKPGTLWVLEQIPGLIVARDQSQHLQETSYWASYNVPYYTSIFNASGQPALVEQYGDWFSYDKTPRALIFKRDHVKVRDLGSMISLMRYNDFKNDPLSKCDCDPPYSGENAISARNDLNPSNGTYPFGALGHRSHAGTDMKVTSSALFSEMQYLAVNGPAHDNLPVFRWSTSDYGNNTAHYGHPDEWDFPVVHVSWSW